MHLLWRAIFSASCLLSYAGHCPVRGASLSSDRRLCPAGEFHNAATGQCQICTDPCPQPLVRTSPCRHDRDTKCRRPSDVTGVSNPQMKSCPFDSFFNPKTGLCQECRRYCIPPLVQAKPCKLTTDVVCRLPRSIKHTRRRGGRQRGGGGGGKTKTGRSRRKDTPGKARPSHHHFTATTASPRRCASDQFYDKERGDCRPCPKCVLPDGTTTKNPCRIAADRGCQSTEDRQNNRALNSNEIPGAVLVEPEGVDRSHSNEYPGARNELRSRVMEVKSTNIKAQ